MSDRYPDQFGESSVPEPGEGPRVSEPGFGEDTAALHAVDRLIDDIAAGVVPEDGDRLLGLLAAARGELDRAARLHPVLPPDVTSVLPDTASGDDTATETFPVPARVPGPEAAVSPEEEADVVPLATATGRHRQGRRGLGLTGRAAAAGGLSVTGMVIAGGVAAAIAVGGFGVAAYHGAIPGIPGHSEVTGPEESSGTPTSDGDAGSSRGTSAARKTAPATTTTAPVSEPAGVADGSPVGLPEDPGELPGQTSGQAEPTETPTSAEPTTDPGTDPTDTDDPTVTTSPDGTGEPQQTTAPAGPADPSAEPLPVVPGADGAPGLPEPAVQQAAGLRIPYL